MHTEIDLTLDTLSRDLSQDDVTIHYWKVSWKRESVDVGSAYTSRACLVLRASGNLTEIFLEIEEDEYDWGTGELEGTTTTHIPLVDVYDVVVNSFGDGPNYSGPPAPYARWLRSRGGQLVRTDLNL